MNKSVAVFCIVERVTNMAALLDVGNEAPVWVPFSLIDDFDADMGYPDGGLAAGSRGEVFIAEWFALKEGII